MIWAKEFCLEKDTPHMQWSTVITDHDECRGS